MIPFRVFDREKKEMWIVLNYHPGSGTYLVSREDDSDSDGILKVIDEASLAQFRFVDFVDSPETV